MRRRRLFEYVKALMVGGVWPTSVGVTFATDAAAEQCERLPAFEFLGHRIGDGQQKFPDLVADDSWTSSEPKCSSDTSACPGDQELWTRSGYAVGDISVDLTYGFKNGKLSWVMMVFDSASHREIREMLIGKYGETYEYTTTVYMMVGGSHRNMVSHWKFREGFLVLTEVLKLPLDRNNNKALLALFPYTITQSPDPEAAQLRMLGERTF
jgi:hypothetical protein